jgi:hypothetical protein
MDKSIRTRNYYPGAVTVCHNMSLSILIEQGKTIIRNTAVFSATYTSLMMFSVSSLVTKRNKQTMQKSCAVRL